MKLADKTLRIPAVAGFAMVDIESDHYSWQQQYPTITEVSPAQPSVKFQSGN